MRTLWKSLNMLGGMLTVGCIGVAVYTAIQYDVTGTSFAHNPTGLVGTLLFFGFSLVVITLFSFGAYLDTK